MLTGGRLLGLQLLYSSTGAGGNHERLQGPSNNESSSSTSDGVQYH